MGKRNILLKLQKKYRDGGYALVSPKTERVAAFGESLKDLYTRIEKDNINDANKIVMYIPRPKITHAFHLSVSIRIH